MLTAEFDEQSGWDPAAARDLERQRGWSAGLLSVILHATLFIAFALLAPTAQPPAGAPERVVGIALVERTANDSFEYFSEGDSGTAQVSPSSASPAAIPVTGPAGLQDLPIDAAAQLPSRTAAAAPGDTAGIPDAAGFATETLGINRGQVGGKTRTQVFGARGEGSEFVYVFDRSSSMGGFGGRPLHAAQAELRKSLDDLASVNRFQIVFYNEKPAIFNPFQPNPPQLFFATEENRSLAKDYVQSITAVGGTRHKEALEFALRMAPDVIFFLTDAAEPELTAAELAEIRRRNRAESIIHAIEFGPGPSVGGENFLTRLAKQNRGEHVYVDVTALP